MKFNKSQKRLLYILAIVVAYAGFDFYQNLDKYSKIYGVAKEISKSAENLTSINPVLLDSLSKNIEYKQWGKNPFASRLIKSRSTAAKPKPDKSFNLTAILFEPGNSLAIINGKIVKEGEFISQAQVREIHKDYLKLIRNNKRFELRITGAGNE